MLSKEGAIDLDPLEFNAEGGSKGSCVNILERIQLFEGHLG